MRRSPPGRRGGRSGTGTRHRGRRVGPTGRRPRWRPRRAGRGAGAASATPPSLGTWRASACRRATPPSGAAPPARASASSPNSSRTLPPGTSRLSSAGVPSATSRPRVEQRDPVGEPVGLLEVLRREEDRDAVRDELADDVPHHPAAARVEARRRLVEEDDPRARRPGSSRGPAGAACRPSRSSRAWSPRRRRSNRSSSSRDPRAATVPGRGGAGRPSAGGSPRR